MLTSEEKGQKERINCIYILEKSNLTRIRFTTITSNEATLGLGLITQYISNISFQTQGALRRNLEFGIASRRSLERSSKHKELHGLAQQPTSIVEKALAYTSFA